MSIDDFDNIFKYEICRFLDINSYIIMFSTFDGNLVVVDLINKKTRILKLCDVEEQDESVYYISLLNDNNSLYFTTLKHIKIFTLDDCKVSYFRENAYKIRINCINTSHDSKMLCSSGVDYVSQFIIKIWDITTKTVLQEYKVNKVILCYPYSINFSYSNDLVIFGQDHETDIQVLDIKKKNMYSIRTSHDDCIINALFTKDDKIIISASVDGCIIFRNNLSPNEKKIVTHHIENDLFDRLEDIYIDNNDEFLYSISLTKCIRWDINTMEISKIIILPEYACINSCYNIIMYDKILCIPSIKEDIILIDTDTYNDDMITICNTNLDTNSIFPSCYTYTKNDSDLIMNVLLCLSKNQII